MIFLDKPSDNFNAVRDGRRSMPLWLDVDLTNARSIAAGTALPINIAGNSFYVDQDTANVGNAIVHFQDTNLGNASAPLFVSAGFIANVPFTQMLVENAAQPGKRLRIFYGVDIDFQAGVNASIAISGSVSIAGPVNIRPESGSSSYADVTPMAVNTPALVLAAGANVNGLIVNAGLIIASSTVPPYCVLIAKATAPANIADGRVIFGSSASMGGSFWTAGELKKDIFVPAGLGLYFISMHAEGANAHHSCSYKLL